MIYLIGAPPRCGKTTLAKKMSKQTKIPWLSCDTLDSITQAYIPKEKWQEKYPYSFLRKKGKARNNDDFYNTYPPEKIISVLKKEAQTVYGAIEAVIACEIADGNDYIIEGYHLVPSFAQKMIKKYGQQYVRAVFLTKFDADKFAVDVHKSITPNDWLIVLTKKLETFVKVGKMVSLYSRYFEKDAKKFGLQVFNTDTNFDGQINNAIKYLIK
jgi:2-phosphoglycerate kinase